MKKVILIRTSKTDKVVYGVLVVTNNDAVIFVCRTIERLAKSFPDGTYPLKFEYSPRFKTNLWELYGIKGRGEIKIHCANYYDQLDGCIGVGLNHQDINKDGIIDAIESKEALRVFHEKMEGITETTIKAVSVY